MRLLLYYGTRCLTEGIVEDEGGKQQKFTFITEVITTFISLRLFHFVLHSFGPYSILHFVTLQSAMRIEERQVGKCKAPVPLAMRHM